MYFFYIDESGTPESSDNTSRFFVVCSTVFHNSQWPELYKKMEGLKRQFFPKTFSHHGSEIKGCDLVSKHALKSYLKRNFAHQILNVHDSFQMPIFTVIVDKSKSRRPCEYTWLYPLCIQYLQISIHSFLEDQGGDHRGILILDEINPKRTLIHSKEHLTYRFGNPKGRQYVRIVETPFFVNSLYSPGIQIADLFATIFRRQEEIGAKGEFCKFTDQFYKRARTKTYETDKMEEGFKITGYLKPFK
jgi:hypothetical protein